MSLSECIATHPKSLTNFVVKYGQNLPISFGRQEMKNTDTITSAHKSMLLVLPVRDFKMRLDVGHLFRTFKTYILHLSFQCCLPPLSSYLFPVSLTPLPTFLPCPSFSHSQLSPPLSLPPPSLFLSTSPFFFKHLIVCATCTHV